MLSFYGIVIESCDGTQDRSSGKETTDGVPLQTRRLTSESLRYCMEHALVRRARGTARARFDEDPAAAAALREIRHDAPGLERAGDAARE